MLPSLAEAGLLSLTFVIPLAVVVLLSPPFMRYLTGKGRVVDDVHKRPATKVPSPDVLQFVDPSKPTLPSRTPPFVCVI